MKSVFFYLLIFSFSLSSNVCNPIDPIPRIYVDGNLFVNQDGETMVFRGLNASDPDKLERDGMWKQEYFDEINNWGANIVRFPIHPSAWRSRGAEAYMDLIERGIEMAKKSDLYVVLDWHSIGNLKTGMYQHERYFTTRAETFEFWKLMAQRFGTHPNIAFYELFNEPTTIRGELGTVEWDYWKTTMEELIGEVRNHGGKGIPLVAGFDWAYDLTEIKDKPIDMKGVAYVSHPYPMKRSKPWEEQWEKDWAYVAEKYPVMLTEVGFCEEGEKGAHVPVIDDGSFVKAITEFTHEKGISYIIWVFDKDWSPHLIEDWDFTPSKSGKVWKDALKD